MTTLPNSGLYCFIVLCFFHVPSLRRVSRRSPRSFKAMRGLSIEAVGRYTAQFWKVLSSQWHIRSPKVLVESAVRLRSPR